MNVRKCNSIEKIFFLFRRSGEFFRLRKTLNGAYATYLIDPNVALVDPNVANVA